jgi:hypothetical protein
MIRKDYILREIEFIGALLSKLISKNSKDLLLIQETNDLKEALNQWSDSNFFDFLQSEETYEAYLIDNPKQVDALIDFFTELALTYHSEQLTDKVALCKRLIQLAQLRSQRINLKTFNKLKLLGE